MKLGKILYYATCVMLLWMVLSFFAYGIQPHGKRKLGTFNFWKYFLEVTKEVQAARMGPDKPILVYPEHFDVCLTDRQQEEITDACYEYGMDPKLLYAIGYVESGFQNIVGDNGLSFGIWQVQPKYNAERMWDGCDLMDPVDNAIVAIQAYKAWETEYGTVKEALMAYNHGYNRSAWSTEYADKVMMAYEQIKIRREK